jgi:MFS family permease
LSPTSIKKRVGKQKIGKPKVKKKKTLIKLFLLVKKMIFEKLKKYPNPLRLSILEGMFASIMLGAGMMFVIPFAVQLGANSIEVGLLTALPALLAAWIQLGSIKLLEIYKTRKTAITVTVFFQSISWLLIALIPLIFPSNQVFWLIIIYTAGTIVGSVCVPLWQSWMRSLTPKEIIGEYFGARNALAGTIVFLAMLISGIMLELVEPSSILIAFSAIFLASFIGRLISSIIFTKIEDTNIYLGETEKTDLFMFIKQLRKNNFGYFVLFGTLMTFAISLVGPFLSMYLLNDLGLKNDYLAYTIIISSSAIASLISMPYWGKIIDKYGTIKTLTATGLLACIYPLALVLIREPVGLTIAEFFSGVIFSGFNLCLANFIYESFEPKKIIKYGAYQSVLFGTASFAGIMLSGLAQMTPISLGIISNTFYFICTATVIIRLAIFTSLVRKISETRITKPIQSDTLVVGILTFEPIRETIFANANILLTTTEDNLKITAIKTMKLAKELTKISEEKIESTIKKAEDKTQATIVETEKLSKEKIIEAEKTVYYEAGKISYGLIKGIQKFTEKKKIKQNKNKY